MIEFGLWAECADANATREFSRYFTGVSHTLHNGRTIVWTVQAGAMTSYPFGIEIYTTDLSRSGIRTVEDALEVSEAGLRLLHHLKSAPDFRYARLDWQAPTIPLAELYAQVSSYPDGERRLRLTCVLQAALLEQIGSPAGFKPFRPGYVWLPYNGEQYEPVGSSDHPELLDLQRELFPTA